MGFRKSGVNKFNKKKKDKLNLVFDESKRRDFLKGFHKRKLQRQKKAQEELKEKLKEEKRRIKQESKESFKKLVVSHRPIPELEDLLKEEYEDEDVTVKIVELSANDIAKKSNQIGQNVPKNEDETKEETSHEESTEDELPGMELKQKSPKQKNKADACEETKVFKTKKDVTKHIKKQATKNVQKSRAFQMKYKQDQIKNKKKSMQMKRRKEKFASKKSKQRHRGKHKGKE